MNYLPVFMFIITKLLIDPPGQLMDLCMTPDFILVHSILSNNNCLHEQNYFNASAAISRIAKSPNRLANIK